MLDIKTDQMITIYYFSACYEREKLSNSNAKLLVMQEKVSKTIWSISRYRGAVIWSKRTTRKGKVIGKQIQLIKELLEIVNDRTCVLSG